MCFYFNIVFLCTHFITVLFLYFLLGIQLFALLLDFSFTFNGDLYRFLGTCYYFLSFIGEFFILIYLGDQLLLYLQLYLLLLFLHELLFYNNFFSTSTCYFVFIKKLYQLLLNMEQRSLTSNSKKKNYCSSVTALSVTCFSCN